MSKTAFSITIIASIIFMAPAHLANAKNNTAQLDTCNVVWSSQSKDSSESMPVGGGDIGLNVWVENNELLFYIARSGTFDENNEFLKLGRVR
ncbi:unnamed protein product, partial [marine sediment metagenome]